MLQHTGSTTIRRAAAEDIPAQAALFAECLRQEPGPYTPAQVEAAIACGVGRADEAFVAGRGFVATWRGQLVGSAAWSWRDPAGSPWEAHAPPGAEAPTAMIRAVAASRSFPGVGLGRRLLNAAINDARAKGARSIALAATLGAVNFYRRAGFTAVQPLETELSPNLTLGSLLMQLDPNLSA